VKMKINYFFRVNQCKTREIDNNRQGLRKFFHTAEYCIPSWIWPILSIPKTEAILLENETTTYVRASLSRKTKNKFTKIHERNHAFSRLTASILRLALAVSLSPNLQRAIYHRPIDRPPASIEKLPST